MNTPSKELLSAVFNTTVKNIELDRGQTEVKIYRENTSCLGAYNIYELAHKCKGWGWLKGYRLISGKFDDNSFYCDVETSEYDEHKVCIAADTEPEAIFKACNYILSQTKLQ